MDCFWGLGLIYGGGSAYVDEIIHRDDATALKRDWEAIGNDMWSVLAQVKHEYDAPDNQKNLPD